jgi:hypothetical protein
MGYGQYSHAPKVSKPSVPQRSEKKRLRHVFDTDRVAHVWAHPFKKTSSGPIGFEQTDARNPQNNLYFKTEHGQRVLYSYRDSYPIGAIFNVDSRSRPVVLLLRYPGYSVTTSGHMQLARSAVSHHYDLVFTVARPNCFYTRDHETNVNDYIERIDEALQKYAKARSSSVILHAYGEAVSLTKEVKKYTRVFGVRLPKLPAIPKLDTKKLAQIQERERIVDHKKAEQRRIEHAKWEAQHKAECDAWAASGICKHTPAHALSEKYECERQTEREEWEANKESLILQWRAGENVRLRFAYNENALLRINIEDSKFVVETSQGVSVPVSGPAGAARLLRVLQALKAAGRTYQTNGYSERVGPFTVQSFKPEINGKEEIEGMEYPWVLTAGCHRIVWEEIERIAPEVLKAEREENTIAYA